jgi:DUF1680 family protein
MRGPLGPLNRKGPHSVSVEIELVSLSRHGGFGYWQGRNADTTIPHIFNQLKELKYIDNLKNVKDLELPRDGLWFSDSDVYKSLEAAIWGSLSDPTLLTKIEYLRIARIIEEAQESDGYVNSWFQKVAPEQRWKDFASGHEMYTAGHLIQAGLAEARVLGKGKVFSVAVRFADLLVNKFGGTTEYASDGHPGVETALIELFRETDNVAYLELSQKMLEGRGYGKIANRNTGAFHASPPLYIQDHLPIREAHRAVGHAVRQMYLNLGVMDFYLETLDKSLLSVQEKMWEDITYSKMYLTGGVGSRHRDESFGDAFELPNDRAYAETCASIGYFMWNWKLLLATGNGRYAALMEDLLYNIISGSISEDFSKFFYSNPLHHRSDHLAAFDEESSDRLPWYRVSCCPPNIARLLGSIHSYLISKNNESIFIHQFVDGVYGEERESGNWSFQVHTNYPISGEVRVSISEMSGRSLKIRIPDWCKNYIVTVDGEIMTLRFDENNYISFTDLCSKSEIALNFEMVTEFVFPHPLIDASRGCVAVRRGPEIYALDQGFQDTAIPIECIALKLPLKLDCELTRDSNGKKFWQILLLGTPFELGEASLSYRSVDTMDVGEPIKIKLIPYSRWGNPVKGGMRVWIPII